MLKSIYIVNLLMLIGTFTCSAELKESAATYSGNTITAQDSTSYEKMIKILQSCTDQKTVVEHSAEFVTILNTVISGKSASNPLHHVIMEAEIERLNQHKWFGAPSMRQYVEKIEAEKVFKATNVCEDPALYQIIMEDIIELKLNDGELDEPSLITNLLDVYRCNDLQLFMGLLELRNHALLDKIREIEKNLDLLKVNNLSRITLNNLIREILIKHEKYKTMYDEFKKKKSKLARNN